MNKELVLNEALRRVEKFEGFREKTYLCTANHLTIGIGTKISSCVLEELNLICNRDFSDRNEALEYINDNKIKISKDTALILASKKIASIYDIVEAKYENLINLAEDNNKETICIVLIDLIYNIGLNKFKSFKQTNYYLKKGLFFYAGVELLNSKYAEDVKGRAIDNSLLLCECGNIFNDFNVIDDLLEKIRIEDKYRMDFEDKIKNLLEKNKSRFDEDTA